MTGVTGPSGWLSALVSTTPPADPLGPVTQNPDQVRQAACRLVESRDVCRPAAPPDTIVQRPSAFGGGNGIFGLFLWMLLIAVVLGIAWVAYRYLRDRSARSPRSDEGDDVDPDDDALAGTVVIDRSREPTGWREEAEHHRAAGRIREALRCRYRALVGDLARRGLLDEIPGRTTGEERNELRVSAPNAVASFNQAADLFDAAWYGHIAVRVDDDDRFQQFERDVLVNAAPLNHRVPKAYEPSMR